MEINRKLIGVVEGEPVYHCEMSNDSGINVIIISLGGIVKGISTPDRNGKQDDIVLGFKTMDEYLGKHPYFGAIIGRYANRIARGRFRIEGEEFFLATNNGENHLHGGSCGFDKKVWKMVENCDEKSISLTLRYLSKDMEENYPGNLDVTVIYTLNDKNELIINYSAHTDKPTFINLTNHSYFNLAGEGRGDVLSHEVMINASHITEVNDKLIPTGQYTAVRETPFDFLSPVSIGSRINETGNGYDHNYILNKIPEELCHAASAYDSVTGRTLEVYTSQPGIQFYTGNFLDGTHIGKGGHPYTKHAGFCFETQHFPDSPNKPGFPTTLLKPGELYSEVTIYQFGTR